MVAFVVTPWASTRLLKPAAHHEHTQKIFFTLVYRRVMGPLIASGRMRALFGPARLPVLLLSMALVPLKLVTVKMLPFDNKSEFQVMVEMPEGTALEATAASPPTGRRDAGGRDRSANVQQYVGASAPRLQRACPSLLSAPGGAPGRPAGEPRVER